MCGSAEKGFVRLSAVLLAGYVTTFSPAAIAQTFTCNLQGSVCSSTDKNCVKLPTTLPIANGGATNGPGWYNDGSTCGFNYDTDKACGDKLSRGVCNAESSGPVLGGGDPYEPCPCDPADPSCGGGDPFPPCGPEDPCDDALPVQLATRLKSIAAVALPDSIERQLQAFAKVQSLHLKARAMVTVKGDAKQRPGFSLTPYEYWAKGNMYRIHTAIDPRLDISNVTDLAFDGRQHQMVMPFEAQTLLSLKSGDTRLEPIVMSNPAFLPLSFLSAKDEQRCPACELRLGDLQQLAGLRSAAKAEPLRDSTSLLRIPGGGHAGGKASFEVSLDDAGRVAKIRHLSERGAVLDTVDFADYRPVPGGSFSFPMRITESRNNEQGVPWLMTKYVVDQIEVNGALEDTVFQIPRDRIDEVYDSDTKTWPKRSDLTAQGLCKQ